MKTAVRLMLAVMLVLALVSANALGANKKPGKAKAKSERLTGTIEKVDTAASQITVKKEAGTDTLTITCGDKTRIQLKKDAAARFAKSKQADLKDGMYTVVLYTTDGDKKVAKSIKAAPTKENFKATGKPAGKGSKSGEKPEAK
jgi:Cu/Ag efflux protein CusF